jgi:hypothetical protein
MTSPPQELLPSSNGRFFSRFVTTRTGSKEMITYMYQLLLKLGNSVTYTSSRVQPLGYGVNSRHGATTSKVPCARSINTNKNTYVTVIISAGQSYISLNIQANIKIRRVKEEIQRRTHITTNEQFLIFGGKVLEDQKCLLHYCIHDFSLIKLSLVLRGGGETFKPPTNTIKSKQSTLKKFFIANEVR